jgi:hypothetical protein
MHKIYWEYDVQSTANFSYASSALANTSLKIDRRLFLQAESTSVEVQGE